ncbi:SHOCT domain-containing protein [Spirochaetia bacterium 38H-sp]|uniref:SHOCT domain-containing protein n=1 Tax=Rarispira pelagica TaxID=3141764 RepID=A0ABU9UBR4_9SPIR
MNNLKLRKIGIVIVLAFLTLAPVMADSDHANLSVGSVLQEIMQKQGVNNEKDIDIAHVPEELLEELGDAVMEESHPGTAHEFMDTMMGGEGSESLRQAHINMGYNYLLSLTKGTGSWGMMGPYNMMGTGMMGAWGGSSYTPFFRYGGIIMMIFGFLVIAGLIALIVMSVRQTGFFRKLSSTEDDENPLDILDRRLARGEITEEEYDKLRKKLTD